MPPRATPRRASPPARRSACFSISCATFEAPELGLPDGQLTYRDALDQDQPPRELTVMLEDVIAHDPDLAKELRARPEVYVPVLEQAAVATVESLRQQNSANPQEGDVVAGVGGSKDMFESVQIQVHLGSDETPRALRSLSSKDVSRLVCVPGIVHRRQPHQEQSHPARHPVQNLPLGEVPRDGRRVRRHRGAPASATRPRRTPTPRPRAGAAWTRTW